MTSVNIDESILEDMLIERLNKLYDANWMGKEEYDSYADEIHQKIVHRYLAAGRSGDKDSASYQAKFLRTLQNFFEEGAKLHIHPLNPMLLN